MGGWWGPGGGVLGSWRGSGARGWRVRRQAPRRGRGPAMSHKKGREPASDRGRCMCDAATAFAGLALTGADASN